MATTPQERYEAWLQDPAVDEVTKRELRAIAGNAAEIEDRFFRDLAFGTGGLRGVMGAGTNRMNRYVIGRATQGFAAYLLARAELIRSRTTAGQAAAGEAGTSETDAAGHGVDGGVHAGAVSDASSYGIGASGGVDAGAVSDASSYGTDVSGGVDASAVSDASLYGTDASGGVDAGAVSDASSYGTDVSGGVDASTGAASSSDADASASVPAAVIAHDSRHHADEFALDAACVLAANGIRTYLFRGLRPTPQLSFAVRQLGATGGIVITASHNPPEYNGYKVYAEDGCQLVPNQAEQVIDCINQVESFDAVKRISPAEAEARGLLVWLAEDADAAYEEAVAQQCVQPDLLRQGAGDRLSIVYTPLHGAGNLPVRNVLARAGFSRVHVVKEQELPDGHFSTVESPNPEEHEAFTLAIRLADQVDADIMIGTDPDCDRMGAVVKNDEGRYVVLTGNQSGAIMVYYLLSQLQAQGRLPADGTVIKTIVTSEMGADIARTYGCKVINTLTGFKYIGEQMTRFERERMQGNASHTFLFGYEESYGYLAGTYARDKDAVLASLLICEAAAYYKSRGQTLFDVLQALYREYGTYLEKLESRTLKGKDGLAKIGAIMTDWRDRPPADIAGTKVAQAQDYLHGLDGLPPENVLKFMLEDGSWFCLRPSGTEPKIKLYFAVRRDNMDDAQATLDRLVQHVMARVDAIA